MLKFKNKYLKMSEDQSEIMIKNKKRDKKNKKSNKTMNIKKRKSQQEEAQNQNTIKKKLIMKNLSHKIETNQENRM